MVQLTFGIWVGPIVLTLLGCRDARRGSNYYLDGKKICRMAARLYE